jgi:uncharacterized protein YbjT (DUF2867 family)
MKIVVIGGSGLIGKKLVRNLRERGHEALSASPSSGVDTITGEGLAKVLVDANTVVDVINSPSTDETAAFNFFNTSTQNLLAAEATAMVNHHTVLSIVGADHLTDSGYMRAKITQEKLVRTAVVPFTILHSTQFFEFLGTIADGSTVRDSVHLPPALVQPIAADDVAAALADIAIGSPANETIELAGPERFRFDNVVQQFLVAVGDPRRVKTDPHARYFGAKLDKKSFRIRSW